MNSSCQLRLDVLLQRIYLGLLLILVSLNTHAAQQFQGLCSYISIEIQQQLTLERVGFLATLEVTNNEGDAVITDFSSALTFSQIDSEGNEIDASGLFFVQPPELTGISGIGGAGLIQPGETAIVSWFIIPKTTAGGDSPVGVKYSVGAQLAGSLYGAEIDPEVLTVIPDTITVKPDPQLEITYFQPRDVDGDNPFTPEIVESSIPFTLGVLVHNSGYGLANDVVIDSEQPQIVENGQGLLVLPQLIGSRINDEPTDHASLTVNLGDIDPGNCTKGAWDMITTLSGEFTEFNASYTHSSELGGEATSIIKSLNAYFLVHEVQNDQPGRDDLLDFLATTDENQVDLIPDTLFESDCVNLPVNRLNNVTLAAYNGQTATLDVNADFENWVFLRIDDPAQAKYAISSVIRSDGKLLNANNYWTNIRYHEQTNEELTYLNIFDNVALGDYQYEVTYQAAGSDVLPPVTTLLFSGAYEVSGDTTYVLTDTQMFFIADDDSPVGTFYRTDGGEYQPAYPFTLEEGSYTLEYYSEDSSGNQELVQSVTIVATNDYPGISQYQIDVEELLIAGDSLTVRPTQTTLSFDGSTGGVALSGHARVYQGVYAWPTLQGIPSSPTALASASLTVGGENVDYYLYQINNGVWSSEQPVATPITLTSLTGEVALKVRARSQYGAYPSDDSDYLEVSWQVDPTTPTTTVTTPETPSRLVDAELQVSGADLYRWTIDGGYYRAEVDVSVPITFEGLSEGYQEVSAIGQIGVGDWQDEATPAVAKWLIDRDYGLELPADTLVYEESLGNLDSVSGQFSWNGRTQSGASANPGWYTVQVTLTDGLGRETSAVKLVRVGDLLPNDHLLAEDSVGNQKEAHGRGRWAVWQDQRSGSWNIYARNIFDANTSEVEVTANILNQERPRTDGQYVVWQARQADGNWDIWIKDLESTDPAIAVTTSSDQDENRPVVEWPWVVYQSRSVIDPTSPWQLYVRNMLTDEVQVVDGTTQDQIDPSIHNQRIVWQDYRDVGPGEIYLKDLNAGTVQRITENTAGQYHPVIEAQWIIWADNRNTQFDLYAYNLYRDVEIQLTNTLEDETRPGINDHWVIYEEDSSGEQEINLRLLSLHNLAVIQLTNAPSDKEKPIMVSGAAIWTERSGSAYQVWMSALSDLQPVFNNRNMVVVTQGVLDYKQQAGDLLRLWQAEAGVVEITRYNQLLPTLQSETVSWNGNTVVGVDFSLTEGDFLWVKFNNVRILDLSDSDCGQHDLVAGVNVLSGYCFPDQYSAYQMIRKLALDNVNALRMLDSDSGRWSIASVHDGQIVGEDFQIPNVAVLLLDLRQNISGWTP